MSRVLPELLLEEILREDLPTVRLREKAAFDRAIAPFNQSIVLFGAGNLGRSVLAQLRKDGIEPLAFVDNNRTIQGTIIDGLTVLAPQSAAIQYGQIAAFVVTAWNANHSFVETKKMLAALGCIKIVSVAIFRWKHPDVFLPFLWAELPSKTCEHFQEIKSALSLWADEFSRQEYLAQLELRVWGVFDFLASPVPEESYFPDDLFTLINDEKFVDCGAYDGVTISHFMERQNSFAGRLLAFEPDPVNFVKLQTYVSKLGSKASTLIQVFPYAVGAEQGKVHFDATGDMGARINLSGKLEVDCVSLDELFTQHGFLPTYIKMDIEGAELDALRGAQNTIRSHFPVLAICCYHRFDDLWRIPAYIQSLYPEYSLFLRPHEVENWQLVCYAVPKNRIKQ